MKLTEFFKIVEKVQPLWDKALIFSLCVTKWAIASFVVIYPSVIAILPTVNLKLNITVLSGTIFVLYLGVRSHYCKGEAK